VDLNTNTITSTIMVGSAPAALAITPAQDFVYCANYVDGNPNTATITKISTNTNSVVTTIGPFSPNGFSGPFAIAITPDGKRAYITNFGSNNFSPFGTSVSVLNLDTNTIISTINLGIQPSGLAIDPSGTKAIVTNYNTLYASVSTFENLTPGDGTINIIDIATNTVIAPTIKVGQSPDYVVITSDGKKALISNYTSNTVNMISL
jgi:YVTN family beta-propeller protein